MPFFPVVILIRNSSSAPKTGGQQSFLLDPIKTMLQTRTARGDLSISLLEERRCGFTGFSSCGIRTDAAGSGDPNPQIYNGVFQSLVENGALELPLGWNMPKRQIEQIEQMVVPDQKLCDHFKDELGGIRFSDEKGRLIRDPLDRLLRRNCSHINQIIKLFGAKAIGEALEFRP